MDPLLGEIKLFGGNFAPRGWMFCNGQILNISQNTALFSILGTTYGGNGTSTFALPNLQSRVPVHPGQGQGLSAYTLGQAGGVESVTLVTAQIPAHNHLLNVSSSNGDQPSPVNNVLGIGLDSTGNATLNYTAGSNLNGQGDPKSISATGSGLPHENIQPYLCLNYIIAVQGNYPSRN